MYVPVNYYYKQMKSSRMEVLLDIKHSFSFILCADRDNPSSDVSGSFQSTTQRFPKELLLSCATISAAESLRWHDCALYGVKSFHTSISITYGDIWCAHSSNELTNPKPPNHKQTTLWSQVISLISNMFVL